MLNLECLEFINLYSHVASTTLLISCSVHIVPHTLTVLAVHIMFPVHVCFSGKRGDIQCKNSPSIQKGEAKNAQVTDFGVLS